MTRTITAEPRPDTEEHSRAKRLKALTHQIHERLDTSIMAAATFATLEAYGWFVDGLSQFHRDIDALYDDTRLQELFPGLAGRRRLPLILADLTDLGLAMPVEDGPPAFPPDVPADVPTALGWLYVAEGSNMGAALLRKDAAKLGLSDEHGARHLAPAPEGPAAHWRAFTAGLDAVELTADEDRRVVAGARAAFARVQALIDARLG